jgi:hypothetical protein
MKDKPTESTVFLNIGGIIEYRPSATPTPESVEGRIKLYNKFGKQLRAQDKPVLILIDATEVAGTDPEYRKAVMGAMQTIDYDKMALYSHEVNRMYWNTLAIVSDTHKKTRAFEDRLQALEWLKSDKD